jgi:hypothetical protein
MRQVEVSRTIVFDAPRHARGFFEALIVDNLDLGRPHNVEIIFGRKVRRDTPGTLRTAIDRRDNGGVPLNVFYKHSRIKQYLKDGRAMRIETVVNTPRDLGCQARLHNLDDLQAKARAGNRRILDAERVGQGCVLAAPAFERTAHPSVDAAGGRTPALRFGDPRVTALTGALCHTLLAATGFTNKHLRILIAGLLGSDYRPEPDDLRPAPAPPQRPHPPATRQQPLHPHRGRHPHRGLLHQALQPAARPAHRRRPAPSPTGPPRRPGHHH